MTTDIIYSPGDHVNSDVHGTGTVIVDNGQTVIVQFEESIHGCEKSTLNRRMTPQQAIHMAEWHRPLEVITKIQAETIQSINDAWGIFSRSRISLLPHQLWVCRKVLEIWPARWLIADDVGLGKTVEAGLILWPLIARNKVKRLLILCPASLAEQWQIRLKSMFDIRMTRYTSNADTERSDYWNIHDQVIASIETLRKDHKGRHRRFLECEPWDLIIVDEAHHLNADEKMVPTLAFQLVKEVVTQKRVASMIFLTGTPHRGKNFGFISLLSLLRPDLFDTHLTLGEQLPHLSQVMIRNNKQNVTDLNGKLLFKKPIVDSAIYAYSSEEEYFYNQMTNFIVSGMAYASSLSSAEQSSVILVLISIQKLASSSVAAIKRAIKGRLARIVTSRSRLTKMEQDYNGLQEYSDAAKFNDQDRLCQLEESISELLVELRLMEDEEPRLKELMTLAENVKEETKIIEIIKILESRFSGRSVLFFTEYKATQSLLMSALMKNYGDRSVTFINGENEAREIVDSSGNIITLRENRESAVERFNLGEVRFLVSTEAAGEGIDLQENCYSLIHVDLPWNPMRLHQRVGRLNRHGQKKRVEVITIRNPQTVESRIWDKLNEKIENIMQAMKHAMDDPDDLFQLVLGMTSTSFFNEIFSEGSKVSKDNFSDWFNAKTSEFGGKNIINTVQDLVGNSAKFDFQTVSSQIPRVDLEDMKPFVLSMLSINGKRVTKENDVNGEVLITFKTPENWCNEPGVRKIYEEMCFNRNYRGKNATQRILGVGHMVVDKAIAQARSTSACLMTTDGIKKPHFVFRITDRVTDTGGAVRAVIATVVVSKDSVNDLELLKDWHLLTLLNSLIGHGGIKKAMVSLPPDNVLEVDSSVIIASRFLVNSMTDLKLSFRDPKPELMAIIWPETVFDGSKDE
ncbi:DEAD/DEAH box helicase [Deltaproteobacteria bacterium TL4]